MERETENSLPFTCKFHPRFEAFTVVKIQVEVLCVVTPCSVEVGYQSFGGPCCLYLHGEVNGFIQFTLNIEATQQVSI
jgi:hypothetical protein